MSNTYPFKLWLLTIVIIAPLLLFIWSFVFKQEKFNTGVQNVLAIHTPGFDIFYSCFVCLLLRFLWPNTNKIVK